MTRLRRELVLIAVVLSAGGCTTMDQSSSGESAGTQQGVPATPPATPSTQEASAGTPSAQAPSATASAPGSAGSPPSAQGPQQPAGASGSAVPPPAQTSEERRDAVDKRLDESLGEFDSELRKERERVAQERDAREAAGRAAAQTEDESDEDGDEASGSAATEEPMVAGTNGEDGAQGEARPGDLKSDKQQPGSNSATGSGSGAGAREIPDGSDDDIIARRLRKAAEQETDPELKEKLWKEYIEYKKSGQGK